jgi:hypothetical protein
MACLHFLDACPDPPGRELSDIIDVRHKWNTTQVYLQFNDQDLREGYNKIEFKCSFFFYDCTNYPLRPMSGIIK